MNHNEENSIIKPIREVQLPLGKLYLFPTYIQIKAVGSQETISLSQLTNVSIVPATFLQPYAEIVLEVSSGKRTKVVMKRKERESLVDDILSAQSKGL